MSIFCGTAFARVSQEENAGKKVKAVTLVML